jgi:hypothetical protein
VVLFTFTKVTTGRSRLARGTLNPSLYSYTFKGGEAPNIPGLLRYWDLDKNTWRSFYLQNVVRFRIDYDTARALGADVPKPIQQVPTIAATPLDIGALVKPRPANVVPRTPLSDAIREFAEKSGYPMKVTIGGPSLPLDFTTIINIITR